LRAAAAALKFRNNVLSLDGGISSSGSMVASGTSEGGSGLAW